VFRHLDDPMRLEASSGAQRQAVIDRGSALRRRRRALAAAVSLGVAAAVTAVIVGVSGLTFGQKPSSSVAPAAQPTVAALPQDPGDSRLDPGRYIASVADAPDAPLLPVLAVPEGYTGIEDALGVAGDLDGAEEAYMWVWEVNSVYSHPCEPYAGPHSVGPTVADLANALTTQPLRAGTDPVPVTVGGYDGLYVELSVPADVDVADCPLDRFNMWPTRWQQFPGQVDMVWIVDVDGQRIVFDASHTAGASPEKVAELTDMVTTATFTPAEGT